MILHQFSHAGSVAFPKQITIDFDSLPALIAIHGRNGSGKTTLMDCITSAFYLQMPFRPDPLHAVFATRGFIDVVWSRVPGGPRYRSRVNVDPVAERTEAVLYPAEGGSAIAGPLQRGYLAKIKEWLGPLDLFLCTSYTTQPSYTTGKNAFSFLLADRADRRAIMGEMLGLMTYAQRYAGSRDKIRAVDTRLSGLRATQQQWEADLAKLPEAQKRADEVTSNLDGAKAGLDAAQKAQEETQEALRTAKEARAGFGPYRAQHDVLVAELAGATRRMTELTEGLQRTRAAIAQAEPYAQAPHLKETLQGRLAELQPAAAQAAVLERELRELEIEIQGLTEEAQGHQAVIAQGAEIAAAVQRDQELEGQLERVSREIDASIAADAEATQAYTTWKASQRELAQRRVDLSALERAALLMEHVPCKGEDRFAGCQFLVDAASAKGEIPAVASAVAELEALVGGERSAPVSATPALTIQRDNLRSARADLVKILALQPKLEIARSHADGLVDRIDGLNRRLTDKRSTYQELQAQTVQIQPLRDQLAKLEPEVQLALTLDARRATAAALEGESTRLKEEIAEKEKRLGEIRTHLLGAETVDARVAEGDIAVARAATTVRQAQAGVTMLEREHAMVVTRLQALNEIARRLARTQAEAQVVGVDLDDWTLLSQALSPSGIPALLIDQALPEISAIATDMLQECLGESLFSISLTTQRASADDKKMLEVLDVLVFRNGKKIAVEHLSGGEGVLVSEALSLAIDLYNARREGNRRRYTFFRDEVGANLDVLRAPAYARLLARAIKLGGYDKGLFVSHHADALAVADARLGITNGQITIT